MRDARGATTSTTGFEQGSFQGLTGVDAGIGGGSQQDRWRIGERSQKNGFRLRGETLRQGAELFEAAAVEAARDTADAIGAGGGVVIEFPALLDGEIDFQLAARFFGGARGFQLRGDHGRCVVE